MALRVPGVAGGAVTLTRQQLESLATPLFRRLRLPVDAACWQVRVWCYPTQKVGDTYVESR